MALKPKLKNNSNLYKEEALKEVVKEKMVGITILVPESVKDNLKVKAIRNKTNITNVLINYIKEYINADN
jgi:phosphoribosyl-dephospho-CoA transferase